MPKTMTADATKTKSPYAFVSIYFDEVGSGREFDGILDDEDNVVEGAITGYYYADISYLDAPLSAKENIPEADDQVQTEVRESPDPLANSAEAADLAAHEAAHKECWVEAKEWLRSMGYKAVAYSDRGVLNANDSSEFVEAGEGQQSTCSVFWLRILRSGSV